VKIVDEAEDSGLAYVPTGGSASAAARPASSMGSPASVAAPVPAQAAFASAISPSNGSIAVKAGNGRKAYDPLLDDDDDDGKDGGGHPLPGRGAAQVRAGSGAAPKPLFPPSDLPSAKRRGSDGNSSGSDDGRYMPSGVASRVGVGKAGAFGGSALGSSRPIKPSDLF
jgi:hypothetical protein